MVTLWRDAWTETQDHVLGWLSNEEFAPRTHFIWTAGRNSRAEQMLEKKWNAFEERDKGYSCELIIVPAVQPATLVHKHAIVAALYEEALGNVQSEHALFVEDDVLPAPGAAKNLFNRFTELPDNAVGLMGAYRSRVRPHSVCASGMNSQYLNWNPRDRCDLTEVTWMGGGFTLYLTAPLLRCRPFYSQGIVGWDVNVCRQLRGDGGRLFVDFANRAEHLCPEVVQHCTVRAESAAS